jgi:hypothetical protein
MVRTTPRIAPARGYAGQGAVGAVAGFRLGRGIGVARIRLAKLDGADLSDANLEGKGPRPRSRWFERLPGSLRLGDTQAKALSELLQVFAWGEESALLAYAWQSSMVRICPMPIWKGSKAVTQGQLNRAHRNSGTKLPVGLTGVEDGKG